MILPLALAIVLTVVGVMGSSFSTAAIVGHDAGFGSKLLVILYGFGGFLTITVFLNWILARILNKKAGGEPARENEGDGGPERRKSVRNANRKSFWTSLFKFLTIFLVLYFVILGIPYLLFGATLGDITSYFFETQAGQMMLIQSVGALPIWLMLPFIYFFAFYGPFVIKVLLFDMKRTEPGSAKFNVKRSDIIGQDEVLEKLEAMLESVADREKLRKIGKKPDRGVILVGPPGTGKTLTLKYLASKYGFPLVQVQSTIARQTFVGVSVIAMWIVQLVSTGLARKYGGAVVLIDEVDVIAQSRGEVVSRIAHASFLNKLLNLMPIFGGADDSATVVLMTWMDGIDTTSPWWYRFIRNTINTLLDATFVDEFIFVPLWNILVVLPLNFALKLFRVPKKIRIPYMRDPLRIPAWQISGDDGIFFIGTTNRPQVLDPALTRYGRFSPVPLSYDLPDEEGRLAYLNYLLNKTPRVPELDFPEQRLAIARMTEGLAQANILFVIENAWRQKRYILRRQNRDVRDEDVKIDLDNVQDSRDMMFHGIPKFPRPSRLEERRRVAIHEAGHFVVTKEVSGETILPIHLSALRRARSYGRMEALPVIPVDIRDRRFFEGRLRVTLASYATELLLFGETTTGVGGDLAMATLIAVEMVEFWGIPPRQCIKADRNRYRKIGRQLASWRYARNVAVSNHIEYSPLVHARFGDNAYLNPHFGEELFDALNGNSKENVEVLLGQAYVFSHLFVEKNKDVIRAVAKRLEDAEWELQGTKVQELYRELSEGIGGDKALVVKPAAPPLSDNEWPSLESKDPFWRRDEQGGAA